MDGDWVGASVGVNGIHASGAVAAGISCMYSAMDVSVLLRHSCASELQPQLFPFLRASAFDVSKQLVDPLGHVRDCAFSYAEQELSWA